MIFDSDWLTELLDGAPDLDTLAEALTDCGCLVELREPGDLDERAAQLLSVFLAIDAVLAANIMALP
jgi:hypothetical protein